MYDSPDVGYQMEMLADRVQELAVAEIERMVEVFDGNGSQAVAAVGMTFLAMGAKTVNAVTNIPLDDDPGWEAYNAYIERLAEMN